MTYIYFAVPHTMPTAEREQVPGTIAGRFNRGEYGRIEFVRHDRDWRLYRMAKTYGPAPEAVERTVAVEVEPDVSATVRALLAAGFLASARMRSALDAVDAVVGGEPR